MLIGQIAPPWIPVPPRDYGGTELMVAVLVQGLAARGWDILLCCAGDSALPVARYAPYANSLWPPEKFSENYHLALSLEYLRQQRAVLWHSHLEGAAGFWRLAGRPVPLVVTLHTPITPAKRDYLLRFPEVQLVAVSDFQRRQLAGHPRVHLIPHGLDLAAYPVAAAKEDYLLFLGRVYPDKGLHTAIAAARRTGWRLLIAGPVYEPDRPYFAARIQPELDGRQIVYLGPADFAQKTSLLSRARALVLPLEVDEAFGLALVEAMACGTPVVAHRRGAAPELVIPGVTGFLTESLEDLVAALTRLDDLQPAACRQWVAERFSAARMVAAYAALYESILANPTLAAARPAS